VRRAWCLGGAGLLAAALTLSASAADIYQWRDKAGIVHFTDDPMQVPAEKRADAIRELEPVAVRQSGPDRAGRAAWEEKCALCHSPDDLAAEGKVALGPVVWPSDALSPLPLAEVVERLRQAARGSYSAMARVDVDDETLESIGRYLLSVNR